jgi:hypothetical protein
MPQISLLTSKNKVRFQAEYINQIQGQVREILFALLSGIKRPKDGRLRNRFSVFLVCISLSTLMWGLIKLTKEYEAPVKYHVIPWKLPDNKILVGNPDSIITLTLNANGFELFSRMIFRRDNSVTVDLSKIKLHRDGDNYTGIVRSSNLLKSISEQLPAGAKLIGVDTDTLHFTFRKSHRKRIPVHAALTLDFTRQYQLYDSLGIRPDSLWIYGLEEIVDTIAYINTEKKAIRNLNSNYTLTLGLVLPHTKPAVKLSVDSVTVVLNVEKFTEADIEVPVSLFSDSKSVSYRTFPEKVMITCRVAMRDYKRLDPSLITAVVDYEAAVKSGNNRVAVEVRRKPKFVKIIRIEPEKVEFLIMK